LSATVLFPHKIFKIYLEVSGWIIPLMVKTVSGTYFALNLNL